jgi:hypothetical protein
MDRSEAPIEGVGLYLSEEDAIPAALTNAAGRSEVIGIPADTHKIFVRHPEYTPKHVRADTAIKTQAALKIMLSSGATLKGTVSYLGSPVANHKVAVIIASLMGSRNAAETRTGAEGDFEFTTLTPGRRSVVATFDAETKEKSPQLLRVEVILEEERTTEAHFYFRKWDAALEGYIHFNGEPASNAGIRLESLAGGNAKVRLTKSANEEGYYKFDSIPSGIFSILIESLRVDKDVQSRTTQVEIPAGLITTKDFTFGGSGVITGICTGAPDISKASAILMPEIWSDYLSSVGLIESMWAMGMDITPIAEIEFSEDGSFRVEHLDAGTYTIIVVTEPNFSEQVSYAFAPVNVTDQRETYVTLGHDFITETVPEEYE